MNDSQIKRKRCFVEQTNVYTVVGGVISFLAIMNYARQVWAKAVPAESSASWFMWLVLDVLLFVGAIVAKKSIWLPLSYVLGASVVFLTLLMRGSWEWGWKENVCAVSGATAMVIGYFSPGIAILMMVVTMSVTGMPLLLNMAKHPVPGSFPLWATVVVACVLTLLGSDWSFEGTTLAWGGIAYNGTVAVLSILPQKKSVSVSLEPS